MDRCDIIKEREGKFGKRMRFNFQIRSPFLFCQSVLTKGFENDNIDIKEKSAKYRISDALVSLFLSG